MDTIQNDNQERALHTSDTFMEAVHSPLIYKGNHIRAAVKKKQLNFFVRMPISSCNVLLSRKKKCRFKVKKEKGRKKN